MAQQTTDGNSPSNQPSVTTPANTEATEASKTKAGAGLTIVVAGDVVVDVFGLERPPAQVSGELPNWKLAGQTITEYHRGGAWLSAEMIRNALPSAIVHQQEFSKNPWGGELLLKDEELARLKPADIVHSFLEVAEFPKFRVKAHEDKAKVPKVYRIKEFHGFAGPPEDSSRRCPLEIEDDTLDADIVQCDDAGNGFRNRESEWPLAIARDGKHKPLIIYKLGRPLPLSGIARNQSRNDLWKKTQAHHRSRTIVVIDANDLRLANVHISRRLSWERTAKDLVWQLLGNRALAELRDCPHLIVCFGNEAAVYYRSGLKNSSTNCDVPPDVTLVYDPVRAEDGLFDEHPGRMSGYRTSFVSGLTATIAERLAEFRDDLAIEDVSPPGTGPNSQTRGEKALSDARQRMITAIKTGICASRRLLQIGVGKPDNKSVSMAYPSKELFPAVSEDVTEQLEIQLAELADVHVPLSDSIVLADSGRWSILTTGGRRGSQLEKIARDVVLKASVPALKDAPFGKFGDQETYDRTEIEGFRAIRNLINEFLKQPVPKRPLCLAVFGPPGSGKSFGVEEVAKSVSGGDVKVVRLEFNVSQFRDSDELAASLQLVRDRVLSGEVPLVFFDEFDAKLEELDNGWLKYFLAPMQDGKFLDRGMLHPIGKAIFVFAGGTRDTFQEFYPRQPTAHEVDTDVGEVSVVKKYRKFRDAKGPDFVSRLRGYINISGPNPRDDFDQAYVIRRAVMLRSILKRKAGHLFDSSEQAQIDDGVLRAMLKVSRFQHGTRSMEAILDMSMLANAKRFEAATLPSADQLELHVPAEEFFQLINADRPFGAARELIARAIHEKYRAEQAGNKTPDHPSMQPWETLRGDLLASNLAQAEDIPNKLSFLGLAFESVATPHYKLAKDNRIVFDDAIKVAGEIMSKEIIIYKNLEILAEMEHERWVSEKLQSGWRYAQSRDDSKKLHTDLVPWVNLPDPTKAYDRNTIKAIPDVLANAGYRLFRANGN